MHPVDFALTEGNKKQIIHSFPEPNFGKESNYPEQERNPSLCNSKHTTPIFIFFK
jgi:hypothetical protein